jgi:hypothetical protein
MVHNLTIVEQMRERQKRMFRVAMDPARYGLTLKAIEIDSGIPYASLRNYASGDTIMPITAVDALTGVVPDELLSLLFSGNRAIVQVPEEIDHDELADAFADYLHEKNAAHHPASEAGRDLGPNETANLNNKVVHLPIKGVVNG